MNQDFYQHNIRLLIYQRNACLAFAVLSSLSLLMLTIFIFWKNERIIVTPAVVEKEFWVESTSVSATYLEQMGLFLAKLALEKSALSAQVQRTILLRHTDPSYAGALNKKLQEEEQLLAKQNASYVFFPVDVHVDMNRKEVLLIGDRTIYVAGKPVSNEREGYVMSFIASGSRLLLKEITAKENIK